MAIVDSNSFVLPQTFPKFPTADASSFAWHFSGPSTSSRRRHMTIPRSAVIRMAEAST